MTYDPVDANDDGIVESDVDNESVSTVDSNSVKNATEHLSQNGFSDLFAAINDLVASDTTVLVEPGVYNVSTQLVIDGVTGLHIGLPNRGGGHNSNTPPIDVRWEGPSATPAVLLSTDDGQVESVAFSGIEFRPDTEGDREQAVEFSAGNKNIKDTHFKGCAFQFWGSEPINWTESGGQIFNQKFIDCLLRRNNAAAQLPAGTEWIRGVMKSDEAGVFAAEFAKRGTVRDAIIETAGGNGCLMNGLGVFDPKNAEDLNGTGIACRVLGRKNRVTGYIHGWDTALQLGDPSDANAVAESVIIVQNWQNVNTQIEFVGGNSTHNRTFGIGNIDPAQVQYTNSDVQNVRLISSHPVGNVSSLPPGWWGFDSDRGGTGTPAMVYGGDTIINRTLVHYWDQDGAI